MTGPRASADGAPSASWVFQTTDHEGTPVILSRATWETKAGNGGIGDHPEPEIRDYLREVRGVVERPDLVFQSTRDPRSRVLYKLGAGRGEFAGKHLTVIVKYTREG
ncbi:MAG: hypothetical protein GW893_24360 [Armatimonadetes bacterium]|nr:hypothetical protein [Armatimonadota bacterium]